MPRSYRQISQYEKEIIELYNQGMTLRAIAEKLGFTHKQVQEFKTRYNKKQRCKIVYDCLNYVRTKAGVDC